MLCYTLHAATSEMYIFIHPYVILHLFMQCTSNSRTYKRIYELGDKGITLRRCLKSLSSPRIGQRLTTHDEYGRVTSATCLLMN